MVHDSALSFDETCNKMISANLKSKDQCENEKKNFLGTLVEDVCGGNVI